MKQKESDEKFCSDCGTAIKIKAAICPKCGVAQEGLIAKTTKSKFVAIILAILFGQWTWLYTYKKDAWKFWTGLLICLFGIMLLFLPNIGVWIWAIIDTSVKKDEFYTKY